MHLRNRLIANQHKLFIISFVTYHVLSLLSIRLLTIWMDIIFFISIFKKFIFALVQATQYVESNALSFEAHKTFVFYYH